MGNSHHKVFTPAGAFGIIIKTGCCQATPFIRRNGVKPMSKINNQPTEAQIPEEDSDIMVTLSLDDGSTAECEILTIFDVADRNYIALLPLDENAEPNEEGEVFLYRYSEDEEGNPSLENIEDDDEYEAVADRFDELLDEAEFDEQ